MSNFLSIFLLTPFERGYQIGQGVGMLLAIAGGIWLYMRWRKNNR